MKGGGFVKGWDGRGLWVLEWGSKGGVVGVKEWGGGDLGVEEI